MSQEFCLTAKEFGLAARPRHKLGPKAQQNNEKVRANVDSKPNLGPKYPPGNKNPFQKKKNLDILVFFIFHVFFWLKALDEPPNSNVIEQGGLGGRILLPIFYLLFVSMTDTYTPIR